MSVLPKTGYRCFTYLLPEHAKKMGVKDAIQDMVYYVFKNYTSDSDILSKIIKGDYRYIFNHNSEFVSLLAKLYLWNEDLVNGDNYTFIRQLDGHLSLESKEEVND